MSSVRVTATFVAGAEALLSIIDLTFLTPVTGGRVLSPFTMDCAPYGFTRLCIYFKIGLLI